MRATAAVLLVGIALAGAVYLGSLKLGTKRVFVASASSGFNTGLGPSDWGTSVRRPTRAPWQIPVAIVIATLGIAGGLVVLRQT